MSLVWLIMSKIPKSASMVMTLLRMKESQNSFKKSTLDIWTNQQSLWIAMDGLLPGIFQEY
jgi:hypothetical protein